MSRLDNLLWGGGVFVAVFLGAWLFLSYQNVAQKRSLEVAQISEPGDRIATIFGHTWERASMQGDAHDDARVREAELAVLHAEGVVPEDLIVSAQNDAPTGANQIRYVDMPGQDGGRLVCASMRAHGAVAHYATTYLPDEIQNPQQAFLPEYIRSGCAKAIRDRSWIVTPAEYARYVIPLLPAGREFAGVRQGFEELAAGR